MQTKESMSGWLPQVMKLFMPGFLDKSLDVRRNYDSRTIGK
jgi:hypothetical protein